MTLNLLLGAASQKRELLVNTTYKICFPLHMNCSVGGQLQEIISMPYIDINLIKMIYKDYPLRFSK
jgi:hypothetical protein